MGGLQASVRQADSAGLAPALQSLVAAAIYPFDGVLAGMVAAGLGMEAICLYLALSRDTLHENLARLDLWTPHDRPLRSAGARAWSALDTARLIAWRVAGIHPATIGRRLGRSPCSVRAKARRLGIPAPPRRALRRADPQSLPDPVPGFGFPTAEASVVVVAWPGPGSTADAWTSPARAAGGQKSPASPAPPRDLPLFCVVRAPAEQASDTKTATVVAPPLRPEPTPHCRVLDVAGIRALAGDISWVGGLKRIARDRDAMLALSLRHFGGEHWRVTAHKAGLSEPKLRTLRTRMDLPRDTDREKFTDRFDEVSAQRNLETCPYELSAEFGTGRWFWRRRGSFARLSLSTQRERRSIDSDERMRFRPMMDLIDARHSQMAMPGLDHEESARSGSSPAFRPGLPGSAGQQVSCT